MTLYHRSHRPIPLVFKPYQPIYHLFFLCHYMSLPFVEDDPVVKARGHWSTFRQIAASKLEGLQVGSSAWSTPFLLGQNLKPRGRWSNGYPIMTHNIPCHNHIWVVHIDWSVSMPMFTHIVDCYLRHINKNIKRYQKSQVFQ